MKNILLTILLSTLVLFIGYVFCSFIQLKFDMLAWTQGYRFAYSFCAIVVIGFSIAICVFDNMDNK